MLLNAAAAGSWCGWPGDAYIAALNVSAMLLLLLLLTSTVMLLQLAAGAADTACAVCRQGWHRTDGDCAWRAGAVPM
jgi:hypothetical protein